MREGLNDLAIGWGADGDVEVVDENLDLAVHVARHGGECMVNGLQDADFGPGSSVGAPCDDAIAGEDAAAECAAQGEDTRMAVSATGGADERGRHADAGGVIDEARMLGPLVELLEVPMEWGRSAGRQARRIRR